jgi:hypothetical protein
MVAQKDNKYAKKLSTEELKRQAFDSYLAHLGKGKSKKSWWFEHPELNLTWETMDKYIREEPQVFDSVKIQQAKSKGYQIWEQHAEDSATGENPKANTASLQMVMRNKFRWDKDEYSDRYSNESLVHKFINMIENAAEEK